MTTSLNAEFTLRGDMEPWTPWPGDSDQPQGETFRGALQRLPGAPPGGVGINLGEEAEESHVCRFPLTPSGGSPVTHGDQVVLVRTRIRGAWVPVDPQRTYIALQVVCEPGAVYAMVDLAEL